LQDRIVGPVGKGDLLKDHLPGTAAFDAAAHGGGRFLVVRQFRNLNRLLQQFADPLNGG
jgi:hypothetical protein